MPSYSFLNEAWTDPVMVQDESGKFIRNNQSSRNELDQQFKDKETKYNFEEKPKVIKNTLPEYGVDDYQIYNKNSNKNSNKNYQNNFDNTFFDNIEVSEEESDESDTDEETTIQNNMNRNSGNRNLRNRNSTNKNYTNKNSRNNRKNKVQKECNIEGSNKYIELKDYVHDLENKINDFKIDSLNKSQSIFGDVNTNEMIIFLALGIFTIMVLDSFTKLGSKLKTHN